MHLGLVETGYDDQKIKIKMKESGTVKQASHKSMLESLFAADTAHDTTATSATLSWWHAVCHS